MPSRLPYAESYDACELILVRPRLGAAATRTSHLADSGQIPTPLRIKHDASDIEWARPRDVGDVQKSLAGILELDDGNLVLGVPGDPLGVQRPREGFCGAFG